MGDRRRDRSVEPETQQDGAAGGLVRGAGAAELVGTTLSDLSTKDLALVEETLCSVRADVETFGASFYGGLFSAHPELRSMFRRPLPEQIRHLVDGLSAILKAFRSPDQLDVLLAALSSVHVGYGVQPEHYPIVGRRLVEALGEHLGPRWTPAHERAWKAVYARILRSICGPADRGLREADPDPDLAPLDVFGMAKEYLHLCRRWRDDGAPFSFEELDRWRSLRVHLDVVLGHSEPPRTRRRRWLRVPTLLKASFSAHDGEPVSALLTEVAERGLFVASDRPLPPGTPIQVDLLPGEGSRPLSVRGRVVWARTPGEPGPPGMGVQLDELIGVEEEAMIDLVERCLYMELRALQPGRPAGAGRRA